jgi:EmrB/QacA subfamily drug resistance transporter
MATFMVAVENTIVATAMPTIVAELGDFHLFSWVFSAYLLSQAVTIPIYGKLADLYGRKRIFFCGAGIFLIGSVLCGFAPHMGWLILFRLIQGFGAGAIQPVAYTIVGDVYAPSERARVQGILSSVFGIAALAGPSLGAFLVTHGHWPIIFWINLPVGAATLLMLALSYRDPHRATARKVDYFGAVLLMVGGGSLMIALVQAADLGRFLFILCLVTGGAAIAVLIFYERWVPEPMLPIDLWRNPVIRLVNLGSLGIGAMIIGTSAFLPTYLQGVRGYGPESGGIAIAFLSISWAMASFGAGRIMARHSYRHCALIGGAAYILGGLGLVVMTSASGPYLLALGSALAIGTGLGFCNTTYVVSAQAAVEARDRGAATSSNLFMRIVGQAAGAAVFGAVVNYGIQHLMPGYSDVIDQLMQPSRRTALSAAELSRLSSGLAEALTGVFALMIMVGAGVLAAGAAIPRDLSARSAPTTMGGTGPEPDSGT